MGAVHEAGHAVVYLAQGLYVKQVCLDAEGYGFAEAVRGEYLTPYYSGRARVLRRLLVGNVAGCVAEHLYDPAAERRGLVSGRYAVGDEGDGPGDDLREAALHACCLCVDQPGRRRMPVHLRLDVPADREAELAEILRAERRAGQLLKRNWPAVVAVARGLLRYGRLTHGRLTRHLTGPPGRG
jgi:hypothetical protein